MKLTLPSWITVARLLLILPILLLLHAGSFWAALVLVVLALFTDWLDGRLARSRNEVTRLGQFLDHFADKLLVHVILLYFVAVHGLSAVAFGIFLVRDFLVLGFRHIAAQRGQEIPSMSLGKIKFLGQGVLLVALVLALAVPNQWIDLGAFYLLWLVVGLSAVSAAQILFAGRHILLTD